MTRYFCIICLLLIGTNVFGQADSTINQTQSIVVIGKVWGFLKYYHPQFAKGKLDWDGQLIELLDELPSIRSKEALSNRLLTLIQKLGPVKPCQNCSTPDSTNDFTRNLNLSWLADSTLFSLPLRLQLKLVAANPTGQTNHYVRWNPFRNRVEFNEASYAQMALPTQSYRLLGLLRYWNIIEYFHPTKHCLAQNWSQILTEFVPKFQQATDTLRYQLVLRQLITRIQDGHAELIVPTAFRVGSTQTALVPPFQYRIVADTLLVTGFYSDSLSRLNDIRRGDRIVQVEGQGVTQLIKERSLYATGSNRPARLQQIQTVLLMGIKPVIQLELLRDGQRLKRPCNRYSFQAFGYHYDPHEIVKPKIVPPTIGYVDMGQLEVGDIKRVMTQYQTSKGIVFDVRTYPKGTFQQLCDYLNPIPTGFARYLKPDLSRPGLFKLGSVLYAGRNNKAYYPGKVAILCNSYTQSAAESTCMALRTAPRAKIIGSQSAGANGDVSYVTFPGDYQTRFTGIGVYTMDGKLIQGQGVPIDIEVIPNCEDILLGRDKALQAAIDWISQ